MALVKKDVSDLGAAAYLMMLKYKLIGKEGKIISFEVEDEEVEEFESKIMEYLSSKFHRFDANIMSLKKITEYTARDREGFIHRSIPDLGAAAYLMMSHYKVVGKRGRSIFFEIEHKEKEEFKNKIFDYLISEYHRFDACIMSLKKIGEYGTQED